MSDIFGGTPDEMRAKLQLSYVVMGELILRIAHLAGDDRDIVLSEIVEMLRGEMDGIEMRRLDMTGDSQLELVDAWIRGIEGWFFNEETSPDDPETGESERPESPGTSPASRSPFLRVVRDHEGDDGSPDG